MTTTAQVLRHAQALIADPDHWIKGRSWDRIDGRDCYCMAGALDKAWNDAELTTGYVQALRALKDACSVRSLTRVPVWNDQPERTHADVIAAWTALAAAEESA